MRTYLVVTIICGYYIWRIFAIWKNRKIKYPQKFLPTHQALWRIHNHKLCDVFTLEDQECMFSCALGDMHNHSPLIVSAFSFLPSPRHHELEKVTFEDIDDRRPSFTSVRSQWRTDARCTKWHVSRKSVFTLQIELQSRLY